MAIILKNDVLYLHIPKTGGNWLTKIASEQGLTVAKIGNKHGTYDHTVNRGSIFAKNGLRDAFNRRVYLSDHPRVFCVVRHPLRWYESWFKYQTAKAWRDWGESGNMKRWHVMSDMNINKADDFNAFMSLVNKNTPGYVSQLYARYVNNGAARFLRNETLAEDFISLCQDFELDLDEESVRNEPAFGVSPTVAFEWDQKILEETTKNERAAFSIYGYAPEL